MSDEIQFVLAAVALLMGALGLTDDSGRGAAVAYVSVLAVLAWCLGQLATEVFGS